MKILSKYQGCLIGGAIGDVLGYPIEFLNENQIFNTYGSCGIRHHYLIDGKARISDDTQMTLFTANGLINRDARIGSGKSYTTCIAECYRDWYLTQTSVYHGKPEKNRNSWLLELPELYSRRAPGNTCMSAIADGCNGTIENPVNKSKGCGGIMRVAPVGLYFDAEDGNYSYSEIQRIAAEAAALTHGHTLGFMPAAIFAHIVSFLAHKNNAAIKDAVSDSLVTAEKLFSKTKHFDYLIKLVSNAVKLAESNKSTLDAIHNLGEGWVAEETLAIAVFCSLRYSDDFTKAVTASVNHNGDSDSTGAVTGNIMGAALGIENIPDEYISSLELSNVILDIADDLCLGCTENKSEIWNCKYK